MAKRKSNLGQRSALVLKQGLRYALRLLGYELRRLSPVVVDPIEVTERDEQLISLVEPFTMTGRLRVFALLQSVRYIVENDVQGALVECGVWRGGSAMVMASTLLDMGADNREIWLYDTFEGMTHPETRDVDMSGKPALESFVEYGQVDDHSAWCYASLEDVSANVEGTGYPKERIRYIKGDVAETLKRCKPEKIAILRLDTDWYESTRVELEQLFPLVSPKGVIIIDDYGYWAGARQAVEEYFRANPPRPLIQRVDISGLLIIKM